MSKAICGACANPTFREGCLCCDLCGVTAFESMQAFHDDCEGYRAQLSQAQADLSKAQAFIAQLTSGDAPQVEMGGYENFHVADREGQADE